MSSRCGGLPQQFCQVRKRSASLPLQKHYATYEVMGEFGIPGRRHFRKGNQEGVRTHQVHTFASEATEVERHLAFRDYLIAHPSDAQRYCELKRKLAEEHPRNMDGYIDGKDGFIKEVDQKAALWRRLENRSLAAASHRHAADR